MAARVAQWAHDGGWPLGWFREDPNLHIGFRTSGGRGEYEVVGSHSGYSAISLEGWSFYIRWPDGIVRDTNLWLDPAGSGKPRLRSMLENENDKIQIGRVIAAMLLLPDPRRELPETGDDPEVVQRKKYVMDQISLGADGTEFDPVTDRVTLDPTAAMLKNTAYSEFIGVRDRWQRIQAVNAKLAALPTAVADAVRAHRDFLASGRPIDKTLVAMVDDIGKALAPEVMGHDWRFDCLPVLEVMANIVLPPSPGVPPPDELPEEMPEIKARSAHQYRLAKVRGPAQRKFSVLIRESYGHRCAFCGGKFGGYVGIGSGLEAAHILAWASYDMDIVQNGMSLCRTHHWAFDAGLVLPVFDHGSYVLRFTSLAAELDDVSRSLLGEDGFVIPDEWLPQDAGMRPSPAILQQYQEDMGVEFIA
jgi:hypothetical protein